MLGVASGVVALTKRDLVDDETLAIADEEVRERLAGTTLEGAPIVPVSSVTGDGLDALVSALDAAIEAAPAPAEGRSRLFVDRVFTIRGSGTVVTGTLTGGCLSAGDEVALEPGGRRARIRALQSHERAVSQACAVTRVAANLAGIEREEVERGDVLTRPGDWRPTSVLEATVSPVRGLAHPLTGRGAFTVHAGASESPARIRLYGGSVAPGDAAFARITLERPLVLDVADRFVVREAGRRETVAGGVVLDVAPPRRSGADPVGRLSARAGASRDELPEILVAERGAIPRVDAAALTGSAATGGTTIGDWLVAVGVVDAVEADVTATLVRHHAAHPLDEGAALDDVRREALRSIGAAGAPREPSLVEALLDHLVARGIVARSATAVRLTSHRVSLDAHAGDVERLVAAVSGEHEALPPDVKALVAQGFSREVIDAAARAGVVVRIAPDIVVAPSLVARATDVVRNHGAAGVTVSTVRETLGTSRKYAVPLLEHLDRTGVTRRDGDLRFVRDRAPGAS